MHHYNLMSKDEEFHFPPEIDEEYKKFCYELIKRSKKGEKIDYAKESANFWNRKIKEAVDSVRTLTDTVVDRLERDKPKSK